MKTSTLLRKAADLLCLNPEEAGQKPCVFSCTAIRCACLHADISAIQTESVLDHYTLHARRDGEPIWWWNLGRAYLCTEWQHARRQALLQAADEAERQGD